MTSEIKVDTISEQTSANGVAVDSVTLKDGKIGIGITSPSTDIHIKSTADNAPHLLLENFQNADTDDAPVIELYLNDQTTGGIGDDTDVGVIRFTGDEKDGGTKETYAEIRGVAHDPGQNTSNRGHLSFFVQSAGALAETMTLDESKVGIGTVSPSTDLHLKGGGANDSVGAPIITIHKRSGGAVADGQTIGGLSFVTNDDGVNSGSDHERAKIIAESQNTSSATRLEFWTGNNNADIAEHMRIIGDGTVVINGAIALGDGLDGGTANRLDDYEEGTYAPVFTVASGSLTPHGSHNALAYTKIGRVVHVQGEVRFSAVSSPSGNFNVSLPFAVADLTDGAARSTSGAIGQSGFGGTPDATYYLRITSEGTTTAFFATHNSGSDTGVNANQVSTSTEMMLSFTFIAA